MHALPMSGFFSVGVRTQGPCILDKHTNHRLTSPTLGFNGGAHVGSAAEGILRREDGRDGSALVSCRGRRTGLEEEEPPNWDRVCRQA